jgi:hypothetical protein
VDFSGARLAPLAAVISNPKIVASIGRQVHLRQTVSSACKDER